MDVFVVINYGYDLFALLMWVICIKEYLYQNDQKPKNYSRLINDNVTCWSNKKYYPNGKFKPSSLVLTNQIIRCLKYDKYIHHRIIYHYVYGNKKKFSSHSLKYPNLAELLFCVFNCILALFHLKRKKKSSCINMSRPWSWKHIRWRLHQISMTRSCSKVDIMFYIK